MSIYTDKLQEYLTANPIKYENQDAKTFIDDLYWFYSQTNPIFNETLRSLNEQLLKHLYEYFNSLIFSHSEFVI